MRRRLRLLPALPVVLLSQRLQPGAALPVWIGIARALAPPVAKRETHNSPEQAQKKQSEDQSQKADENSKEDQHRRRNPGEPGLDLPKKSIELLQNIGHE